MTSEAVTAKKIVFEDELVSNSIEAEPTSKPQYNFEYKVADDEEQAYISREEERDGNNLSGTYSYVDADGGLVTVNYEAGPLGYSETREVQDGFVQIRAKPIQSTLDIDTDAVAVARTKAARAEAERQAAARREAARAEAARVEAARAEAARLEAARLEAARRESASVNTNTLVTQVLATLQPLISQTVQEVVSSSSESSSSSSSSSSNISSSSSSISTGDVSSNFGTGGLSVSVETPDFQFAF